VKEAKKKGIAHLKKKPLTSNGKIGLPRKKRKGTTDRSVLPEGKKRTASVVEGLGKEGGGDFLQGGKRRLLPRGKEKKRLPLAPPKKNRGRKGQKGGKKGKKIALPSGKGEGKGAKEEKKMCLRDGKKGGPGKERESRKQKGSRTVRTFKRENLLRSGKKKKKPTGGLPGEIDKREGSLKLSRVT